MPLCRNQVGVLTLPRLEAHDSALAARDLVEREPERAVRHAHAARRLQSHRRRHLFGEYW